ncbi:hypothetical protein MPLSOD_340001 [Mesorhizobium sp. SOD10]|nr:hypothetical protein MPLSOD_340001 [Mesorhizobium sp. SOD10]
MAICAKAFVADAASSDRTGPLGASGDAGDRRYLFQPRRADVELASRLFHDHVPFSGTRTENLAQFSWNCPWLVIHRYAFGPSFSVGRSYS